MNCFVNAERILSKDSLFEAGVAEEGGGGGGDVLVTEALIGCTAGACLDGVDDESRLKMDLSGVSSPVCRSTCEGPVTSSQERAGSFRA